MSPEQEKSTSEILIESLGHFIQEKAAVAAPLKAVDQVSFRQYASLILFCCNVIIIYLTIDTFFSTFTRSPVWQMFGKIAPIAVGSGFLVAKSEKLQKQLMRHASSIGFLIGMIAILVLSGAMGMTQSHHFQVPVKIANRATLFCAEEVDNIEDVVNAVERRDLMPNEHCAGGRTQSKGERYLKHLRLGTGYMITVRGQESSLDRYYLSGGEIFKRSIDLKKDPLTLETVTLTVHTSFDKEKNIKIQTTRSPDLIYVPEGCWLDENEPTIIACTLQNGIFSVQLMPGSYYLASDDKSCSTQEKQPLEVKNDEQVEMECH